MDDHHQQRQHVDRAVHAYRHAVYFVRHRDHAELTMFTRIRPIPAPKRPGFTLLEATLSGLLTGVLLCASLGMVGAFARARANRQDQSRATLLADQLMGEILQYAYTDPNTVSATLGPEAGETRATFN